MSPPLPTRPVRPAPPRLARAAALVFSALAKKTRYADPALADHWPSIAGGEIAALCRPGRLTGGRAGRTLEVHAPSGAAAAQLQMRMDDLIARVNRYLGPGAVARIAILQKAQGLSPQETARETPQGDDASPLSRALASFRAAVANKGGPEKK